MVRIKRVVSLVVLVMASLLLTSCNIIHPDTEADLASRVNLNLDELRFMMDSGFINIHQYNQLEKALREAEKNIRGALDGDSFMSNESKYVGPAIVNINEKAKGADNLAKHMGTGDGTSAIGFTDTSAELLAQVAKVELYVLRELGDGVTLDNIIDRVKRYEDSKKDDFETYFRDYFVPAKTAKIDSNGREVKDDNGDTIMENVVMELPPAIAPTKSPANSAKLGHHFSAIGWQTFKECNHRHGGDKPDCTDSGPYHKCNIYINGDVACDKTKDVDKAAPLCDIRLYEVNPEFMSIIRSMDDSGDMNYIFHRDSAGGVKMILLNYPISYIESIEKVEGQNDLFNSVIKTSDDLYINLRQGRLKRKLDDSGIDIYTDVAQNGSELYLTDSVSISNMRSYKNENTYVDTSLSGSSFELYGNVVSRMNTSLIKDKEIERDILMGSIVLRDYVETVYMPGVSYENWIATGRKIRFERYSGTSRLPWATYVDNSGNPYNESYMPKIYIQDLLENQSGSRTGSKYFNKLRPSNEFELGLYGKDSSDYEDTNSDGRVDGSVLDVRLQTYYMDSIKIALEMPGEYLNSSGITDNTDKTNVSPVIYCIKTDKSMFETKLRADWLNSSDTLNSVVWWNTWLMNNGFRYQIDINNSNSYFEGTYGYERDSDGYINFNLDTIKRLQDDLDTQNISKTVSYIRAMFTSMGIVLMYYGLIVLGAWAFDVNISIGVPLLKLLTLGKMIAVTEKIEGEEEAYKVEGKKVIMMDFKNIVLVALGISMIGVTCALFDVIGLVESIIRLVTTIVVELYKVIF